MFRLNFSNFFLPQGGTPTEQKKEAKTKPNHPPPPNSKLYILLYSGKYMRNYGDNPDPKEEEDERVLAEQIYLKQMAEKDISRLEKTSLTSKINKRQMRVPDSVYHRIYEEGKNLSFEISKDTSKKSNILRKYLPGRFEKYGTQPLCDYEEPQIGKIFNSVMEYSRKRTNQ